jgi:DNA recombination protein RmuC
METALYVFGALLLGAGLVWLILGRKRNENEGIENKETMLLLQQMNEMNKLLDTKLSESRRDMTDAVRVQFSESQKLLREINEQMNKSLVDVAREQTKTNEATTRFMTIAEQLASLEKTLKHQKQRGNLGEASLELILSNILPPGTYKMQHEFANKEKVDAIIVTKEGIIPVDAKFSLDNYNRVTMAVDDKQREELEKEFKNDLKKRIDETAKYIRPEEGTLPFAFMFIPAEGIYYDLLINEVGAVKVNTRNLIDYAYNDKKVIIVSPTTFAAYLQSVLYGFKAFKIEEGAKEIGKRVEELGKHLKAYEDYMNRLGNALGTTVNHYNAANKELGKIDKDVTRITGGSPGFEPLLLEKPNQGE